MQSSAGLDAKSPFLIFKYILKTIHCVHPFASLHATAPKLENLSNPLCLIYTNICQVTYFHISVLWFIIYFKDLNELP